MPATKRVITCVAIYFVVTTVLMFALYLSIPSEPEPVIEPVVEVEVAPLVEPVVEEEVDWEGVVACTKNQRGVFINCYILKDGEWEFFPIPGISA